METGKYPNNFPCPFSGFVFLFIEGTWDFKNTEFKYNFLGSS